MTDYRHGAACRSDLIDPEIFFPLNEETGSAAAKAVCASCPVRAACLEWACSTGQTDGVWGEKTTQERRALRVARRLEEELDLLQL